MKRLMEKHPKEFNITPISYIFPEEYEEFEEER
jgi:hypothetical protein